MLPNALHWAVAFEFCIMLGYSFHSRATMPASVWQYCHIAMLGGELTNDPADQGNSTIFAQIFAYWSFNLERENQGTSI